MLLYLYIPTNHLTLDEKKSSVIFTRELIGRWVILTKFSESTTGTTIRKLEDRISKVPEFFYFIL